MATYEQKRAKLEREIALLKLKAGKQRELVKLRTEKLATGEELARLKRRKKRLESQIPSKKRKFGALVKKYGFKAALRLAGELHT